MNWKRNFVKKNLLEILIFFFVLIFGIVAIVNGFLKCADDKTLQISIPVISALLGGACTFFGVFITLRFTEQSEDLKDIEQHKPEFFVSTKYDVFKAIPIKVVDDKTNDLVICDKKIYFKNTDKASFKVEHVVINGKSHLIPLTISLVEKGNSFSINFKYSNQLSSVVIRVVNSIGRSYDYKLEYDNNYLKRMEGPLDVNN